MVFEVIVQRKTMVRPKSQIGGCGLVVSKRFPLLDRFSPQEQEEKARRPTISKNQKIPKLVEILRDHTRIYGISENYCYGDHKRVYTESEKEVQSLRVTEKDIVGFIAEAGQFEKIFSPGEFFGVFLSLLCNSSRENEILLNLEDVPFELGFVGFRNSKKLEIRGDPGYWCGHGMKKGEIALHNNAKSFGHYLSGGRITVNGNAYLSSGHTIGNGMTGGEIVVNGFVCGKLPEYDFFEYVSIAPKMTGGVIRLNGPVVCCGLPNNATGGDIFQNGKQLVKDGRVVAQLNNGEF
jgi:formylmethanofuran dehydrogenase subunit C